MISRRFTKFIFVGREFWHALQTRLLTLSGTFNCHIACHNGFNESELKGPGCFLWISANNNWYPDFTVYSPSALKGHVKFSHCWVRQRAIFLTSAASKSSRHWSSNSSFHTPFSWSINWHTFIPMSIFWIGDTIFGLYLTGTQLSPQKLIDFLSALLQIPPFLITSLPFVILFQACEAELEVFTSIIEQSEQNLVLVPIRWWHVNFHFDSSI